MAVTTRSRAEGRRGLAVVVATGALLLAACGGGEAAAPGADGSLSIATGGTGGVYYPYGGAMGTVLSEKLEGITATAQETNASVDNVLLVQDGGADIAFALGDTVADAVAGKAQFEGREITVCTLGKLYDNFTQTVTTSGTGIRTIADLRGKRVSVGSPGSGTEVIALRILEAAGINPETDIQRSQLGVGETAQALRDGTIDAGFWSGGLPTGALVDLATTGQMVVIPTGEYTDELAAKFGPYYQSADIPAGDLPGPDRAEPAGRRAERADRALRHARAAAAGHHADDLREQAAARRRAPRRQRPRPGHGGRRRVRGRVSRCQGLLRPGAGLTGLAVTASAAVLAAGLLGTGCTAQAPGPAVIVRGRRRCRAHAGAAAGRVVSP